VAYLFKLERKDQVRARALDLLKQLLLRGGPFQHIRLQAQPFGELVFEDEVRLAVVADPLLDFHIQVLTQLLTDCQLRGAAGVGREVDFELIQVERVGDGSGQLVGDGASGDRAGSLREGQLLTFAQLVHRLIEDD